MALTVTVHETEYRLTIFLNFVTTCTTEFFKLEDFSGNWTFFKASLQHISILNIYLVLAGEIFDLLGAEYDHDSSGMFLWGRVSSDSSEGVSPGQRVSDRILYEAGVFITPGFIFGKNGEDYIRISLCAKPEVLKKAAQKIKSVIF